jgi:hypothetical protein
MKKMLLSIMPLAAYSMQWFGYNMGGAMGKLIRSFTSGARLTHLCLNLFVACITQPTQSNIAGNGKSTKFWLLSNTSAAKATFVSGF